MTTSPSNALLVLRGKDLLIRHLHGGERLSGEITEALLKSLFDPHSIGHDGAVIIEGHEGLKRRSTALTCSDFTI